MTVLDVGEWVWLQVLEISEPIHPLLPALIDEFVDGILDTSRSGLRKITDIELKKIFNKEGSFAPKVKALYYILRFNEMVNLISFFSFFPYISKPLGITLILQY